MELRRKQTATERREPSTSSRNAVKEGNILNSTPSVVVCRTEVNEMMAVSVTKEDATDETTLTSIKKRSKTDVGEEGGVSATPSLYTGVIDDDDLGPLVPSTKMQKLSRRLGREKQLHAMRKLEQSDSRRERYFKRQRMMEGREETDNSLLEDQEKSECESVPVKKQVKWNETIKYHSYTPEPVITCKNSYTN